jgi:hypothetical protein
MKPQVLGNIILPKKEKTHKKWVTITIIKGTNMSKEYYMHVWK